MIGSLPAPYLTGLAGTSRGGGIDQPRAAQGKGTGALCPVQWFLPCLVSVCCRRKPNARFTSPRRKEAASDPLHPFHPLHPTIPPSHLHSHAGAFDVIPLSFLQSASRPVAVPLPPLIPLSLPASPGPPAVSSETPAFAVLAGFFERPRRQDWITGIALPVDEAQKEKQNEK